MCLGSKVQEGAMHFQKRNMYKELIYLLINFLQEPNYNGPFIAAHIFYCAQPVTLKHKNILDWLNHDKWASEIFDGSKFENDIKDVKEKFGITTDNIDR